MKNYLLLLFLLLSTNTFSQDEIKYYSPPSYFNDIVKIDLDDILSTEKLCKLKLIINNTSNSEYFVVNTKKIGFEYKGLGLYFPKRGKSHIIKPKKKMSNIIKVDGSMDYRVNTFNVHIKSLKHGIKNAPLEFPNFDITIGEKHELEDSKVTVIVEKSSSKKGKVSLNLSIKSSLNENELLNFNPTEFKIKDLEGNDIEYKINFNKEFNFLNNKEKKYKITFESENTSFKLSSEKVFYLINLQLLEIPPFLISNGKTPTPAISETPSALQVDENNTRCNSFKGNTAGSVEVLILTEGNICFKMDVDDFTYVSSFSRVAKLYMTAGSHKFKVFLDNGAIVEKTVYIADTYSVVGYNVKEKSSGKYTINYLPFKQVFNEKGKAENLKNK